MVLITKNISLFLLNDVTKDGGSWGLIVALQSFEDSINIGSFPPFCF